MKTTLLATSLLIVLFSSCGNADLQIVSVNSNWDAPEHSLTVTFKNAGTVDAGHFWVYVSGEKGDAQRRICAQSTKEYASLAAGASQTINVDFNTLPYTINDNGTPHTVNDIRRINIILDAKREINESNEDNNSTTTTPCVSAGGPADCGQGFPNPVIAVDGRDNEGRIYLKVLNWCAYKDNLFRSAPDLPACGLNTSSSRTWINIFNANTNSYMYGFCNFNSREDLNNGFWFSSNNGAINSGSVYITLEDRECNVTLRSNTVSWQFDNLAINH